MNLLQGKEDSRKLLEWGGGFRGRLKKSIHFMEPDQRDMKHDKKVDFTNFSIVIIL